MVGFLGSLASDLGIPLGGDRKAVVKVKKMKRGLPGRIRRNSILDNVLEVPT